MSRPISIADAEHYTWGGVCDGWHLVRTPALSVIQESMPPGAAEARHRHAHARQFFYVLDGALTMEVSGALHTLAAGQGLEIAPGTPHQAMNHSSAPVAFLVMSQPASHGDREAVPATALILPGLNNSGPEHWQSEFERADASCVRVHQDEWDAPSCAAWVARLDEALAHQPQPVVLVAHSSSCAMVAHWAAQATAAQLARVRGALLVAPSDPTGPHYPVGPTGFAPVPLTTLPFASIVVSSDNDPYVSLDRAREYAAAWGSRLEVLHAAGHINAASGHGPWPDGFALVDTLRAH